MIENHHIKLHEKSCPLNPINLKQICEYLKRGIVDTRYLKRASFYEWAITNRILTSITITNRFKLASWQQALYQLLIYGYLQGFIEFVYVEMILYIISHGDMWLENSTYREVYDKTVEEEFKNSGIKEHLYFNYYLLLMHILHRTNQDIKLVHGSLDENKEVVDVYDATTFLISFAPELYAARLKLNLVGADSIGFSHIDRHCKQE
jgi:hypothetical protein